MLFLCSFIRVTVVGFLLEPMTYLLLGLSHFSNVRYGGFRLLEWALNLSKKKMIGYSHNTCDTVTPANLTVRLSLCVKGFVEG